MTYPQDWFPEPLPRNPKPRGRPHGVARLDPLTTAWAALRLIATDNKRLVAREFGLTYEEARTIGRGLRTLAA